MRRLWLNRSVPAKKSGQNIPKNRCRTTIAERVVETRAELPFIGDQVGLSRTQPGRPKRQTFPTLGVDRPMFLQRDLAVHVPNLPIQLPAARASRVTSPARRQLCSPWFRSLRVGTTSQDPQLLGLESRLPDTCGQIQGRVPFAAGMKLQWRTGSASLNTRRRPPTASPSSRPMPEPDTGDRNRHRPCR